MVSEEKIDFIMKQFDIVESIQNDPVINERYENAKHLTIEKWCGILSYMASEKMAEETEKLKTWTWRMAAATGVLVIAAIIQIVSAKDLLEAVRLLSQ